MTTSIRDIKLFDELHDKRAKQSEVLDDFAMRGIKQSVVDMYNQKAHFIYELLQNADDARASDVTFELYRNKLVFKHNGKERFSVSEEREDAIPYGHINAITAIGFSGKRQDEGNKIGKFGIGFKAIYQYSSTPEIYDESFCFKIENFVVPTMLTSDYPGRALNETVFVFPFDQPINAFNDIKAKLESLNNPILFLRHLKRVSVLINGKPNGCYSKVSKFSETLGDISHNLYEIDNHGEVQTTHLFTRSIAINGERKDNYYICIGYLLTANGDINVTARPNSFCFFPTSEKFGEICCITHAPFELVNSRQQFKDTKYNDSLKSLLAILAAEALPILRDYYLKLGRTIFDGNILKIIPSPGRNWEERADLIFRKEYIKTLKAEKLLLTREKTYASPDCMLLASNLSLANLISTTQLEELKGVGTHFVNAKVWKKAEENYNIMQLLTDDLDIKNFDADDFLYSITPDFMDAQSYDWVKRLYNHLHKKEHETWDVDGDENGDNPADYSACSAPIIKTSKGDWVSAYNNMGELNIFFPLNSKANDADYKFINDEYLKDDITRNFLKNALNITQPDAWSYIKSVIFQHCQEGIDASFKLEQYFEFIYKYLQNINDEDEREDCLTEIKKSFALSTQNDTVTFLSTAVYYDSTMLKSFLRGSKYHFVDSDKYSNFIKRYTGDRFRSFLLDLGVIFKPAIQTEERSYETWVPAYIPSKFKLKNFTAVRITDYYFPNIAVFADNNRKDKIMSKTLWSWLSEENLSSYRYSTCRYRYYNWNTAQPADSKLFTELRSLKWICLSDGRWVSPAEIYIEDLEASDYPLNDNIVTFLQIQRKERDLKELGLTEEELNRNRMGKLVEESGLSDEEAREALAAYAKAKAIRESAKIKHTPSDATRDNSKDSSHTNNDVPKSPTKKSAIEKKREEWKR